MLRVSTCIAWWFFCGFRCIDKVRSLRMLGFMGWHCLPREVSSSKQLFFCFYEFVIDYITQWVLAKALIIPNANYWWSTGMNQFSSSFCSLALNIVLNYTVYVHQKLLISCTLCLIIAVKLSIKELLWDYANEYDKPRLLFDFGRCCYKCLCIRFSCFYVFANFVDLIISIIFPSCW